MFGCGLWLLSVVLMGVTVMVRQVRQFLSRPAGGSRARGCRVSVSRKS